MIVKFVRRYVRDRFYNTRKIRKHLRDKTARHVGQRRVSQQNIYISESLTKKNRDFFNDCLKAQKDLDYEFVWTQGGKIFMRKDTHSLAKYIKSQGAQARTQVGALGARAPPPTWKKSFAQKCPRGEKVLPRYVGKKECARSGQIRQS